MPRAPARFRRYLLDILNLDRPQLAQRGTTWYQVDARKRSFVTVLFTPTLLNCLYKYPNTLSELLATGFLFNS
jgi:hypothetical protein